PDRPRVHGLGRLFGCGFGSEGGDRRVEPEGGTEVAARFDEAAEVEQTGVKAAGRPGPGLAGVVDAGPQELPEYVVVVADRLPSGVVVTVFAAVDHALRVSLVVDRVPVFGVVVTGDVERVGVSGCIGHHHTGEPGSDRARGVDLLHFGRKT